MGEVLYQEYFGRTKIFGFVEGASGSKIQIRVSGIIFGGSINRNKRIGNSMPETIDERLDVFNGYKGSTLKIGSIVWDDTSSWTDCQ